MRTRHGLQDGPRVNIRAIETSQAQLAAGGIKTVMFLIPIRGKNQSGRARFVLEPDACRSPQPEASHGVRGGARINLDSYLYAAAGAEVVVVADRAGGGERSGAEGLTLIRRLEGLAPRAVVVCAGASQRELVERGVRELGVPRTRLLGSAPEALVAAARAIIALEQHVSPADVALTVLGVPPARIMIAWEGGAIGGVAITRVLTDPVRRRLTEKIAALWPTGPYTLASAAGKVVEILAGWARRPCRSNWDRRAWSISCCLT